MLEPAVKDKRHWWHREDVLLLVLLAILYLLPGLGRIPLFDRDEPRFATAARGMLETGDYIVPRFNGDLRPDKPPLVYWLMDAGYTLTGGPKELGARLPSAFCCMLTLIVVYFAAGSRFGRLTGFAAAMILGSCPLFIVEGRLATADGTMLLFIAICMALAWQAWEAGGNPAANGGLLPRADFLLDRSSDRMLLLDHLPEPATRRLGFFGAMLFWLSLAAGTLAKGVPLLFVLVPMISLSIWTGKKEGRWSWRGNWSWWGNLRPLVGIPLLIVSVGWWVLLAGQRTDWALITNMVQEHFVNRVTGGSEAMRHYSLPPGFYAVTVWATFWPWSILIVPAAYHAIRRVRGKTAITIDPRPYQFLIAWIVPMWIGLELSRGKLFHYPLPLFLALAILCADALVQSWHRLTDVLAAPWFGAMRWITLAIWLGLGGAILVVAKLNPDPAVLWRCLPLAAGLMATGAVSTLTWGKPTWPIALVMAWGGTLVIADILLAEMPELQVSRIAAAQLVEARDETPNTHFGVLGYEDATLVFYSDQNVKLFKSLDEMLDAVPFGKDAGKDPWALVIDETQRAKLDARGIHYSRIPRTDMPANLQNPDAYLITGINAGNLQKSVTVSVITNAGPPATATFPAATPPETSP